MAQTLTRDEETKVASHPGKAAAEAERLKRSLGMDGRGKWIRRGVWLAVLAGLGVGGYLLWQGTNAPAAAPKWQTVAVEQGDLTTTVTATGSLKPVRTVDIGAEISGRIVTVAVKENDRVTAGQKLVEIDPTQLVSKLEQAEAQLDMAKASVRQAQAALGETRSEEKRQTSLKAQNIASQQTYDSAKAARAKAQAQLASAEAQERQAQASVNTVKTDLAKAVITSPIDGIVLSKSVEPGVTVASSFQAPTLMTIAEDLTQMELHLDVDEADVGLVKAGQKAKFTVDAYPDKSFEAEVQVVWFASQTVSNVVTYRAVLSVQNPEMLLRPGMTTTATITTGVAEDVLMVPNAALRYTPPRDALGMGPRGGGRMGGPLPGMGPPPGEGRRTGMGAGMKGPKVWVLREGALRPAPVEVGKSDGQRSEVRSERLKKGDLIVIGQEKAGEADAKAEEK